MIAASSLALVGRKVIVAPRASRMGLAGGWTFRLLAPSTCACCWRRNSFSILASPLVGGASVLNGFDSPITVRAGNDMELANDFEYLARSAGFRSDKATWNSPSLLRKSIEEELRLRISMSWNVTPFAVLRSSAK